MREQAREQACESKRACYKAAYCRGPDGVRGQAALQQAHAQSRAHNQTLAGRSMHVSRARASTHAITHARARSVERAYINLFENAPIGGGMAKARSPPGPVTSPSRPLNITSPSTGAPSLPRALRSPLLGQFVSAAAATGHVLSCAPEGRDRALPPSTAPCAGRGSERSEREVQDVGKGMQSPSDVGGGKGRRRRPMASSVVGGSRPRHLYVDVPLTSPSWADHIPVVRGSRPRF